MTDNELKNRCNALAAKACANCHEGKCFDPDSLFFNKQPNDPPCAVVSKEFTIPEGGVVCDYFLLSVLPEDAELNSLVLAEINKDLDDANMIQTIARQCVLCAKPFMPASNRQRYCVEAQSKRNEKEMPPIIVSDTGIANKRLFSPCLGFGKPRKIKAFSGLFLPGRGKCLTWPKMTLLNRENE